MTTSSGNVTRPTGRPARRPAGRPAGSTTDTFRVTHADADPLDDPIWSALTTRQAEFAEGDTLARRYPLEIAPFGAMADRSEDSFAEMAGMVNPGERVALFTVDRIEPPPTMLEVVTRATIDQMVGMLNNAPQGTSLPVRLTAADAPEMQELVDLAKPGPWGPRTHELGTYLGIRVDGQLVAMVGERFKLDGYIEVSAVCTHPDHRGQGYAYDLISAVSRNILQGGNLPFLHVFQENAPAIALYRKLGFQLRQTLNLTVLAPAS